MRTDAPLSATLQFSTPLVKSISSWPASRSHSRTPHLAARLTGRRAISPPPSQLHTLRRAVSRARTHHSAQPPRIFNFVLASKPISQLHAPPRRAPRRWTGHLAASLTAAHAASRGFTHTDAPLSATPSKIQFRLGQQADPTAACPTSSHALQVNMPPRRLPHSQTRRIAAHLAAARASARGLFPSTRLKATGFITTQHKTPGSKGTRHPDPEIPLPGMLGRGISGLG
jgi:hypothetical protein